jgi:hypothetical protein
MKRNPSYAPPPPPLNVSPSGPHFASFTFLKEVVEITLQTIALYHASNNGVTKGFLQFHAAVIALNSVSALLISLRVTARRAQQVLLLDSTADLICKKNECRSLHVSSSSLCVCDAGDARYPVSL